MTMDPHIYAFVKAVEEEQVKTTMKINTENNPFNKRKAYLQKQDKRNRIKERYTNEEID